VISAGADNQLDRSAISASVVDEVASQNGVTEAAPFGATAANITRDGSDDVLGVSLVAVDPASFVAPEPESGDPLGAGNGVIIDETLANEGVGIGDTLVLDPGGTELTVIGSVSDRSYRLIPTLYMPISLWQDVRAESGGAAPDAINAVVYQGEVDAPDG